ncbi:MAG: hypothetical protein NWE98_05100 [Candidatus Bathyarchaeota archaeon]|nr:hypothetical protein [Candidatus Bathyarchaeota archaeon]
MLWSYTVVNSSWRNPVVADGMVYLTNRKTYTVLSISSDLVFYKTTHTIYAQSIPIVEHPTITPTKGSL